MYKGFHVHFSLSQNADYARDAVIFQVRELKLGIAALSDKVYVASKRLSWSVHAAVTNYHRPRSL